MAWFLANTLISEPSGENAVAFNRHCGFRPMASYSMTSSASASSIGGRLIEPIRRAPQLAFSQRPGLAFFIGWLDARGRIQRRKPSPSRLACRLCCGARLLATEPPKPPRPGAPRQWEWRWRSRSVCGASSVAGACSPGLVGPFIFSRTLLKVLARPWVLAIDGLARWFSLNPARTSAGSRIRLWFSLDQGLAARITRGPCSGSPCAAARRPRSRGSFSKTKFMFFCTRAAGALPAIVFRRVLASRKPGWSAV